MNLGNPIPAITLSSGVNNDVSCANLGDGSPFYDPSLWRFVANSAGSTLTGFESDVLTDAQAGFIRNDGTGPLTLTHHDTRSTSANRMSLPGGGQVVLPPGWGVAYTFDSTAGIVVMDYGRPLASPSVPSPARADGTAFQVSTTRDAVVSYGVEVSCTATVLNSTLQEGYVKIQVGPTSTPTVEYGRDGGSLQTGGLTVAETVKFTGSVGAYVPAGYWVLLTKVSASGSPTITLTSVQVETLVN